MSVATSEVLVGGVGAEGRAAVALGWNVVGHGCMTCRSRWVERKAISVMFTDVYACLGVRLHVIWSDRHVLTKKQSVEHNESFGTCYSMTETHSEALP